MSKRSASGRGWVRWVVGVVGLVVVLLVAIVVLGPMLVPAATIRDQVASLVHDATGRDLKINGDLSVSTFPTLAVTAKNVTFANAPWAGEKPMMSLDKLDIQLRLLPLLGGRVEVASFILEKPYIDLQTDKNGHGNWEFGPPQPAAAAGGGTAGASSAPSAAAPAPAARSSGGGGVLDPGDRTRRRPHRRRTCLLQERRHRQDRDGRRDQPEDFSGRHGLAAQGRGIGALA